ncbi:MAG: hypothetical protein KAI67_01715 [Candidatus Pacebacteria bacterium]|nr:hypothetical protein [Candidatus Paceibacterota bacterium]
MTLNIEIILIIIFIVLLIIISACLYFYKEYDCATSVAGFTALLLIIINGIAGVGNVEYGFHIKLILLVFAAFGILRVLSHAGYSSYGEQYPGALFSCLFSIVSIAISQI